MAVMCTLPFGTSLLFAVKCFKLLALAEATASGRQCAAFESLQWTEILYEKAWVKAPSGL